MRLSCCDRPYSRDREISALYLSMRQRPRLFIAWRDKLMTRRVSFHAAGASCRPNSTRGSSRCIPRPKISAPHVLRAIGLRTAGHGKWDGEWPTAEPRVIKAASRQPHGTIPASSKLVSQAIERRGRCPSISTRRFIFSIPVNTVCRSSKPRMFFRRPARNFSSAA